MIRLFLSVITFSLLPIAAFAQNSMLYIEQPYAFATSSVQKNGAVFFRATNQGGDDEKIVSASTDIAERVELHTHMMDGDIMQMREVENFTVLGNESLTLKPMGDHVMLFGLKQRLVEGESFPVTLTTEDGAELTLDIVVRKPGMVPEGHDHDHEHHHDHHHGHGH